MVACRASRLNWQTTLAVIKNRNCARRFQRHELEHLEATFEALHLSVAQRIIRFGSPNDCAIAMTPAIAEAG